MTLFPVRSHSEVIGVRTSTGGVIEGVSSSQALGTAELELEAGLG